MHYQIQILKNLFDAKTINKINCQARLAVVLVFVGALLAINATTLKAAGNHLDYNFISNGKVVTDFGGTDTASAVAVQSDGKIVVAGSTRDDTGDTNIAVARYNTNGLLDTSFNGSGKVTTDFFGNTDSAGAIIIQPDGKIVIAGNAFAEGRINFAVVRYNANGSLDTTFSGNGKVYFNFSGNSDYASSVALQTDGKILVVGYAATSPQVWAIGRLNANGTLDSTFGTGGKITTNFGSSSLATGIVVQPDGKIVGGGYARPGSSGNYDFALARYNSNGSLDTTFGNGGVVLTDFGGFSFDEALGLKLMSDGKLVLAGYTITNVNHIALARYTANGSLDTSFGSGGKVVGPTGVATDLVVQSNGDIIVSNYFYIFMTNNVFDAVRFLSNGSLDASFGTGGVVRTYSGVSLGAYAIAQQTDGRIVVAGELFGNFLTVRYNQVSTAANADFSQDGRADFAVFRRSNGVWYISNSVTGANTIFSWGANGDLPAPGDYDRDGKTDAAIFRPSTGTWYIIRSSDGGFIITQFGLNGDKPVAGDYDGDGFTDIAVFRPSNSTWYIQRSSLGFTAFQFGVPTDNPTPADYDGDGLTDAAVFRPTTGVWYLNRSALGVTSLSFGLGGDLPTPADYDGDGRADVSVWRPSTGIWYVYKSSTNSATAFKWGINGDVPADADFDGDGKTDYVVFRPSTGIWYVSKSTDSSFLALSWGISGDIPISSTYVP